MEQCTLRATFTGRRVASVVNATEFPFRVERIPLNRSAVFVRDAGCLTVVHISDSQRFSAGYVSLLYYVPAV